MNTILYYLQQVKQTLIRTSVIFRNAFAGIHCQRTQPNSHNFCAHIGVSWSDMKNELLTS